MNQFWKTLAASTTGAAVATLALGPAPASAQGSTVEEVTVVGKESPKGKPETMTYRVGFSDLDLKTKQGRDELNRRVLVSATYVCDRLAVDDPTLSKIDCKAQAVTDATPQVNKAIHLQRAHGVKLSPGPAWIPPTAH